MLSRKLEPVNPIEIRSNLKNEDQIQNENRMTSQICIGDLRKTASKVKVRLKIRKVTNLKSLKIIQVLEYLKENRNILQLLPISLMVIFCNVANNKSTPFRLR